MPDVRKAALGASAPLGWPGAVIADRTPQRRARTRGPAAEVGPPPRRSSGRAWEWTLAALLLLPNLVLLIVFTYRPLLDNIRLSFTDWNISSPIANPVGLSNYIEWFGRDDTRRSSCATR